MPKSHSCYERLRSFLTRRGDKKSCSSDTGDEFILNDFTENSHDEKDIHYFNHAAQAPLSAEVQKLGIELIRRTPWAPIDDRHSASYNQARVRSLFASLVDSDENENEDAEDTGSRIAMFPSTAFAITLAARNIARQQRDCVGRILLLQDQFDSAVYPWQQVCDESGGKLTLEIVGHPDEGDLDDCGNDVSGWTLAVLRKLKDDSADKIIAACLPPLHWSDGTLLDLETIGKACRERNVPLIVDATQGAYASPFRQAFLLIIMGVNAFRSHLFEFLLLDKTSCWNNAMQRAEDPANNVGL